MKLGIIMCDAKRSPSRRVHAFAMPEAKGPPAEIQLWNVGDNATDYGVHKWTARSVAEVFGRYEARGNPLLIDVEHNGATVEGEPAVTGGYARLEIRSGAPWLVFDWSAYACEQIATRQRLFLSPEYEVDTTTGEIVSLRRVSLVADPGTHRARMLASAAINKEIPMDLAMLLAALNAALAAEDPAVCKESIAALVAELSKAIGAGEAPAAEVEEAAAEGDQPLEAAAPAPEDKVETAAEDAPKKEHMAASKPADKDPALKAVTDDALRQIRDAQRDMLLQTDGDRIAPSLRVWASSQPFEVVKSLLDAAPPRNAPSARVAATRGVSQISEPGVAGGLRGEELEQFNRSVGIVQASSKTEPYQEHGVLVLPLVKPSDFRRVQATAAAKAAGKDQ